MISLKGNCRVYWFHEFHFLSVAHFFGVLESERFYTGGISKIENLLPTHPYFIYSYAETKWQNFVFLNYFNISIYFI